MMRARETARERAPHAAAPRTREAAVMRVQSATYQAAFDAAPTSAALLQRHSTSGARGKLQRAKSKTRVRRCRSAASGR